jgi:hypothetical protein
MIFNKQLRQLSHNFNQKKSYFALLNNLIKQMKNSMVANNALLTGVVMKRECLNALRDSLNKKEVVLKMCKLRLRQMIRYW